MTDVSARNIRADLARPRVKKLPRPDGLSTWSLDVGFLKHLERNVIKDGWDSPSLEVIEIIALECERRIVECLE